MITIRSFVISNKEPSDKNVGWLKPTKEGNYILSFYNRGNWTEILIPIKIEPSGSLTFETISDIPNIITEE